VWSQNIRVELGTVLAAQGDFAAAGTTFDTNIEKLQDGSNDQLLAQSHLARARLRLDQDKLEAALSDADLGIARMNDESVSRRTRARLHATRAEALAVLRRPDEAEAAIRTAESLVENEMVAGYPTRLTVRLARIRVSIEQQQSAEALRRAKELLDELRARSDRTTLWDFEEAALRHLARAQRMSGQVAESCASLEQAITLRAANALADDPRLARSRELRARCQGPA
jgi:tetratricopeptide (TPR) repeat protein